MSNTIKHRMNPVTVTDFNKKYISSRPVLDCISQNLNNTVLMNDLNYLFSNPADFFVSVRAYPFNVLKYFNMQNDPQMVRMQAGKIDLQYLAPNQDKPKYVITPVMPVGTFYKHIGTFKIDRYFNNYLDFSPYTKIELYVPFCGIVTLDTNLIIGKEIRLFYSVDFDTGKVTTYIIKHEKTSDDLIMTCDGIIGFELPIGSNNANENAKSLLMNAATLIGGVVTSIATSNPLPLIATGLGTAKGTFTALQERVSKGCQVNGANALVSPYYAYLIITRPKLLNKEKDFSHVKGLPLGKWLNLSDLKGFTIINDIDLSNVGATEDELKEILSLLKSGVYL